MARLYNLDNNHINLVLGIRVDLNESIINLSISKQALILHEQILYESFLDSLKTYAGSKWNQTVTKISDWKDAAVVLGKVISDPQTLNNFSSDVWKKFQKTYLVKFYDLLRKVGLDNLKSKINKFVQSVTNLSGWKKFIAATSISAITKYILDKLSNLNSDGLNAIIEKYFSETALDDILSKLTDFKSYLGWLEPIISGVGILYDVLKNSIDRFKVAFTLKPQTESKGNIKMNLRQIIEEEMLRRLRIPNNDASVKRFSAYAARLYKESYGSDFDGPGLVVTARTTRDNNLIKDIVEDNQFIAYWNAREGYWFFPEEVETLDSLENALSEIFDDIGVNASFESQE